MDEIKQTTPVKFYPINDQVLIRLDVKPMSVLEAGITKKPKVLPSGTVLAVGRGVFIPGTGFVETQVKPGDHVAISMGGEWVNLPIAADKDDIHISVSESVILGRIEGADIGSPWWSADQEAALVN